MKDKRNGMPITECVCLRPKMYSILTEEKNIKKAKGTKKYVVQKEIGHTHYKEAPFSQKIFRHEMNMLRSWAGEQNLAVPI